MFETLKNFKFDGAPPLAIHKVIVGRHHAAAPLWSIAPYYYASAARPAPRVHVCTLNFLKKFEKKV
jgi:hypothetical protein